MSDRYPMDFPRLANAYRAAIADELARDRRLSSHRRTVRDRVIRQVLHSHDHGLRSYFSLRTREGMKAKHRRIIEGTWKNINKINTKRPGREIMSFCFPSVTTEHGRALADLGLESRTIRVILNAAQFKTEMPRGPYPFTDWVRSEPAAIMSDPAIVAMKVKTEIERAAGTIPPYQSWTAAIYRAVPML